MSDYEIDQRITNAERAIAPGPRGNVPPRPKRGY